MRWLATLLLLSLAVVVPGWASAPDTGYRPGSSTSNVPQDYDGDGSPDFIACGDYDGDGTADMQDVQACYDALTDTGGRHLHLLGFDFARGTTANSDAYLEVVDDTNVNISCEPGAVLHGHPYDANAVPGDADDLNLSALIVSGTTNFAIDAPCRVNGGNPTGSYTSSLTNPFRFGIRCLNSTGVRIRGVVVENVFGTGIYANSCRDVEIAGSTIQRVGGWGDTGGGNNAAIYIYTDSTSPSLERDWNIHDNVIRYFGTLGISTRRGGTTAERIENIRIERNLIQYGKSSGIRFGGCRNCTAKGNVIENAGGGGIDVDVTGAAPTAYHESDVRANVGLHIEGNTVTGSAITYGIVLSRRQQDTKILGNHFSSISGIEWDNPQRGLVVANNVVESPGYSLLEQSAANGATPEERVVVRGNVVGSPDSDPVDATFIGAYTEANAAAVTCSPEIKGRWLATTNATNSTDCTFASGTSTATNRCECSAVCAGGANSGDQCWSDTDCPASTCTLWADRTLYAGIGGNTVPVTLQGGKGFIFDSNTVVATGNSGITTAAVDMTGAKFSNLKIDGSPWGFLGELAIGAKPGCTWDYEGKWFISTDATGASCTTAGGAAKNRCRCVAGTWTESSGTFTGTRQGISLTALTAGEGPTFSNIECNDFTAIGACINIPTGTTAVNGLFENITSRYRQTGEAAAQKHDYTINIVALGTGWVARNVRGLNLENASPVNGGFMLGDYEAVGTPPAGLCDSAQEYGSTWRNVSGGVATTFYGCENTGVGWLAK